MSITRREFLMTSTSAVAALAAGGAIAAQPATQQAGPVQINDERSVLDIVVNGRRFVTYNYNTAHAGTYRPYFHPVMGPNDRPVTQNGEFPGTLRGHYWHRALFVAHQRINNVSFWEERLADCGKIVHVGFDEIVSGAVGRAVQTLSWRDLTGKELISERRTLSVPAAAPGGWALDIGMELTAMEQEVRFAATPYNLLACRVINAMCRVQEKQSYSQRWGSMVDFSPLDQGGRITNSEGQVDDAVRGQRARWCDFSGPLGDGSVGGIAILDHPANPRHPTPWHNWNNMTITAALTFHEPLVLKLRERVTLNYRVLVHGGDAKQADLAEAWNQWAATKGS
jgi:hypothetical protein